MRCCWDGGCWLPVLHFHSEIWAACMEAEGGEGALGDAVLHSPVRFERPVDVIGRSVIELTKAPWRERRSTMGSLKKAEKATGLQTAARSAGSRSIGIHGSWTVRPSCFCRRPQCFGELVVGR